LRKLIQMHKEGDTVKLTLHRSGKKQTQAVTLSKRSEGVGMYTIEPATAFAVMDKQKMNAEVQRSMEEARKSIQDALSQSAKASHAWHFATPTPPAAPQPPELPEAVDVGEDASVTVTKDGASVKSLVKSDDTGVLVIVANPKKRLTAHDQNGKLLFDGEIETREQQQKVPADLWKKVEPLLEQFKPAEDAAPQPHAQSESRPKILKQKIETKPDVGVFASV